jgi:hypothetical protein
MAHTVVITSVTHQGDAGIATGTVDGQDVTINFWWSALTQKANVLLAQTFLAGLMVAAAFPPGPTDVSGIYGGTIQI